MRRSHGLGIRFYFILGFIHVLYSPSRKTGTAQWSHRFWRFARRIISTLYASHMRSNDKLCSGVSARSHVNKSHSSMQHTGGARQPRCSLHPSVAGQAVDR